MPNRTLRIDTPLAGYLFTTFSRNVICRRAPEFDHSVQFLLRQQVGGARRTATSAPNYSLHAVWLATGVLDGITDSRLPPGRLTLPTFFRVANSRDLGDSDDGAIGVSRGLRYPSSLTVLGRDREHVLILRNSAFVAPHATRPLAHVDGSLVNRQRRRLNSCKRQPDRKGNRYQYRRHERGYPKPPRCIAVNNFLSFDTHDTLTTSRLLEIGPPGRKRLVKDL